MTTAIVRTKAEARALYVLELAAYTALARGEDPHASHAVRAAQAALLDAVTADQETEVRRIPVA